MNSENASTPRNQYENLNRTITLEDIKNAIKSQNMSATSFDHDNIHPSMIAHLPTNALAILVKIFNLCMEQGEWVWDLSDVIFLKKEGKPNYMKAGAYRPITISSYVGKLLERVLEERIKEHCESSGLIDDDQEGFRAARNTTRYLYKLAAKLKEAQRRKFTSFLLCLDFQKAFDSVWLKGLIVKLHTLGITGNILQVINSFLFNRSVKLKVNGISGETRKCGNYGVPQGSVLSPLLFIIYINDMFLTYDKECREYTSFYKYADDGSIAVTHKDPKMCQYITQKMCNHLTTWCNKWKLKVNCDVNKTECLIIRPDTWQKTSSVLPMKLTIDGNTIQYVKKSKVLGLVIDDELQFSQHANKKLQQCWFTWYSITRNSNRYSGLNISSLVLLFKSVVLTKLFYAAPVWLQNNITIFRDFYARACLKITGSTHYASQNLSLLAMGLEPLEVHNQMITTKFCLKALYSDNNMRGILLQIEGSRRHPFYYHIDLVKKYLLFISKRRTSPIPTRHYFLSDIPESSTRYTKMDIETYKYKIWKDTIQLSADTKLKNTLTLTDLSTMALDNPNSKLLFPRTSQRSTDTKVMDLLHGHSLTFKSFAHKVNRTNDPNCDKCGTRDDNYHQLLYCTKFSCSYRESLLGFTDTPSLALSIIFEANADQVKAFRTMAQIIQPVLQTSAPSST